MTEAFPFLNSIQALPGVRAAWIPRVPDLEITGDRDAAMRTLRPFHEKEIDRFSPKSPWWRAEQVHGTGIATVPDAPQILAPDGLPVVPGVDGLITRETGVVLAIYAADCGVIWLADSQTGAIGLLHSGKNGTSGNIFAAALGQMQRDFGTDPAHVTAVLSPCIRPPDYEIDFAAEIGHQADRAGIANFVDSGENTASDLSRHYSYRIEKGQTGRMMALIVRDFLP